MTSVVAHEPRPTSSSSSTQRLNSHHFDFIHDVAFDHYGRRVATCSGDRSVRVWDLDDDDASWKLSVGSTSGTDWKAYHRGSVTRLSWAHPEFGQLLATCGTDHAATVWEEVDGGTGNAGNAVPHTANAGGGGGAPPTTTTTTSRRWVAKAHLTDARRPVTCVAFAPRHLGLKLATGSADGVVRIYEAIDVMNLNHWPLQGSMDAEVPRTSSSSSSSSSTTTAATGPFVSEALASGGAQTTRWGTGELGVSALSWCTGRFEPPMLVVGGASSGNVTLYRYSDTSRTWDVLLKLPGHAKGVLDVAWSPNVGRSYHLIASAGRGGTETNGASNNHNNAGGGGTLRVHRLARVGKSSSGDNAATGAACLKYESTQYLESSPEVWRCTWNVTGTVLASSGDGALVQLWKCNAKGTWNCVSQVRGGGNAGGGESSASSCMTQDEGQDRSFG